MSPLSAAQDTGRTRLVIWGGLVAIPSSWSHLVGSPRRQDSSDISWNVVPASVLVDGNGCIHAIEPASAPQEAAPTGWGEDVELHDARGCLVSPGFVDGHKHLWHSLLRSTLSDASFLDYACDSVFVAASLLTPRQVRCGTLCGARELVNAGVTGVVDFSSPFASTQHVDGAREALETSGLRAVQVVDLDPPFDADCWPTESTEPADVFARLRKAPSETDKEEACLRLLQRHEATRRVQTGLSLDAFGQEPLEETARLPHLHPNLPRAIHAGTGLQPFAPLLQSGLLNSRSAVIHANALSHAERASLAGTGALVVSTPEVECLVGLGGMTQSHDGRFAALGTDSVAFSSSSPFVSMRIALAQARNDRGRAAREGGGMAHPIAPACASVLTQAVFGAAPLFGPTGEAPEVPADVVITSFDRAYHLAGCLSPEHAIPALVLQASSADVRDVLIDGIWRKKGGQLVEPDAGAGAVGLVDTGAEIKELGGCREALLRDMARYDVVSLKRAFAPVFKSV